MEYARAQGFPVPAIEELSDDGTSLVMERIEGPLMIKVLGRRPWTLRRQAAVLAELHRGLHQIPAPEWVAPAPGSPGGWLLHLDLHPLNVILGPGGPVVIDWSNAASGVGDVDVALTWVLMASGGIPFGAVKRAVLARARALLVNGFLRHFDLDSVRAELPAVVDWKVHDPNMTPAECEAMRQLAALAP